DEIQGVMAHEFSHIVHGDMRLNIRLTGLIFGIMVIGLLGQILFRGAAYGSMASRRNQGNAAMAFLVFGILLTVIGSIGTFAARLIQAAVSRQREFLADAAAVDYTRNPAGIAGALRRIGGMSKNTMSRPTASQFEHFFFTPALVSSFATHPPLPVRIAKIERRDVAEVQAEHQAHRREIGVDKVARMDAKQPSIDPPPAKRIDAASIGFAAVAGAAAATSGAATANWRVRAASEIRSSVRSLGDADEGRLAYARSLLGSIPTEVRDAVGDEFGARAVCILLMVDRDSDVRKAQGRVVDERADPATASEVMRLRKVVEKTIREGPELRLVLLDLAMPALFRSQSESADNFLGIIDALSRVDGKVDRFEWLIYRLLRDHLEHLKSGGSKRVPANRPLKLMQDDARMILAMVAWSGSRNGNEAQMAFRASTRVLDLGGLDFPGRRDCSVTELDRALDRLKRLRYADRGRLLDAAVEGICADGRATIAEVELLRALAGALSCPMPPVLPGSVSADDREVDEGDSDT
ncbi:MAG: M48 family metalloprotease, partial [Phycisphaera sp.]|nr:M48 family metalloprotease [Phycisphaera sp.]